MRSSLSHPIKERRQHERRASWRGGRPLEAHIEPVPLEPTDAASYQCQCGLVFSAPVSTTVHCPHCGTAQDW